MTYTNYCFILLFCTHTHTRSRHLLEAGVVPCVLKDLHVMGVLDRSPATGAVVSVHLRVCRMPSIIVIHTRGCTIQYNTIRYDTIRYDTIQYNKMQYNRVSIVCMRCIRIISIIFFVYYILKMAHFKQTNTSPYRLPLQKQVREHTSRQNIAHCDCANKQTTTTTTTTVLHSPTFQFLHLSSSSLLCRLFLFSFYTFEIIQQYLILCAVLGGYGFILSHTHTHTPRRRRRRRRRGRPAGSRQEGGRVNDDPGLDLTRTGPGLKWTGTYWTKLSTHSGCCWLAGWLG